jgi:Holliday junction resolvasome RuvABC DNA-binding subunit
LKEIDAVEGEQKFFKDIVKSLKNLGYDTETVKTILTTYKERITKENMSEVIKRVISQI